MNARDVPGRGRRADLEPCRARESGGTKCESQATGPRGRDHVGMQSHPVTDVEIESLQSHQRPTPTCTCPIRATMPWRTAADSIRARTACSSMDLSNGATTLANSAATIAPSHHRRPRVRDVDIGARMPQPDRALDGGLRRAGGLDQVHFNIPRECRRRRGTSTARLACVPL